MPSFRNGDIELAYLDEGERSAAPIMLVHGFASSKEVNWVYPEWVKTLTGAGRRVIALDNRGHGKSSKLYERAACMGYSMGARICAFFALAHPRRAHSLILGGLGIRLVDGIGLPESIADALLAPSLDAVSDPTGRQFRAFADQTRSDRRALADCIRGSRQTLTPQEAASIAAPTLIAVGTKDDVAGSAHELAALMRNARALDIPDRDHMLAVGDKVFKSGVLHFLDTLP